LAECYAASFQPLVTQLFVYTGDLALANDLVQDAFCRALPRWQKLSTYDDPARGSAGGPQPRPQPVETRS
jgi:RNA polymerase sigma-70 factor (ECF subfamily)